MSRGCPRILKTHAPHWCPTSAGVPGNPRIWGCWGDFFWQELVLQLLLRLHLCPGCRALLDAQYRPRQVEACALLHQRHQLVELRTGLRAGDEDANGVKEF